MSPRDEAPRPIAWLHDVGVGSWIAADQLVEQGLVGSLVPPRFESYVSVRLSGEDATVINPDRALREHLVAALRDHTTSVERCFFAIYEVYGWDGRATAGRADLFGGLPVSGGVSAENLLNDLLLRAEQSTSGGTAPSMPPLLETPLRNYMLYSGSVDDADAIPRAGGPTEMPDLWWPDDRSWFVATDTDLDFVVVAGPESLTGSLARPGVHVEGMTARSWLA